MIYEAPLPEPQLDAAEQVIQVVRAVHPSLQHDVFSVTFLAHTAPDPAQVFIRQLEAVIDLCTTSGASP